jgi:hypothetical protein
MLAFPLADKLKQIIASVPPPAQLTPGFPPIRPDPMRIITAFFNDTLKLGIGEEFLKAIAAYFVDQLSSPAEFTAMTRLVRSAVLPSNGVFDPELVKRTLGNERRLLCTRRSINGKPNPYLVPLQDEETGAYSIDPAACLAALPVTTRLFLQGMYHGANHGERHTTTLQSKLERGALMLACQLKIASKHCIAIPTYVSFCLYGTVKTFEGPTFLCVRACVCIVLLPCAWPCLGKNSHLSIQAQFALNLSKHVTWLSAFSATCSTTAD